MLTKDQENQAHNLKLSENFTLYELIQSRSYPHLVEYPSEDIITKLTYHAKDILQPIRDEFGVVWVNSGYRNPLLNKAVGGVPDSIHQIYYKGKYKGTATDIVLKDEKDLTKVMFFIKNNIPAVRRIIIYRNCSALGITAPFLHIDRAVDVPPEKPAILMEKISKGKYIFFDEREFNKFF